MAILRRSLFRDIGWREVSEENAYSVAYFTYTHSNLPIAERLKQINERFSGIEFTEQSLLDWRERIAKSQPVKQQIQEEPPKKRRRRKKK